MMAVPAVRPGMKIAPAAGGFGYAPGPAAGGIGSIPLGGGGFGFVQFPKCVAPPRGGVPAFGVKEVPAALESYQFEEGLMSWQPRQLLDNFRISVEGAIHQAGLDPVEQGIDKVLGGKGYTIKRQSFKKGLPYGAVGQGAFGLVYCGTKNNATVGIKLIRNAGTNWPLLARELEILRMLHHPSIVNFVEAFADSPNDRLFVVMEFVEGGDMLKKLCEQPSAFEEGLCRVLLFHITCALAYAHQQNIVHRDIKPENILLTKNGFPKVADFGISRRVDQSQFAHSCCGTPLYSAPEVMTSNTPSEFSADVYSLGLVVRDMLSKTSCAEWLFQQLPPNERERFTKKWEWNAAKPDFSQSFKQLQLNMVAQVPGKRPSMFQVCNSLKEEAKLNKYPYHEFWQIPTETATGPPKQRAVSPQQAAQIACQGGYAVGSKVFVQSAGKRYPGTVTHVSTDLCPGAVHVRRDDQEGNVIIVCPWQFKNVLQPDRSRKPEKWMHAAAPSGTGNPAKGPKQPCCSIM